MREFGPDGRNQFGSDRILKTMRSSFRWSIFHIPAALALAAVCAQDASVSPERQIREVVDNFARAANARDAGRLSQLFTARGEIIVQDQLVAAGPDDVRKSLAPAPLPWSERTSAVYRIERIQLVQDAAIVYAARSYYTSTSQHSTNCTFVLVKNARGWQIASFRQMQFNGFPIGDAAFEAGDRK